MTHLRCSSFAYYKIKLALLISVYCINCMGSVVRPSKQEIEMSNTAKYQIASTQDNGYWFARQTTKDCCWTDQELTCTFQSADEAEAFAGSEKGPIGEYEIIEVV